jgi:hypothetical protein
MMPFDKLEMLRKFSEWLGKQPPTETYKWADEGTCVVSQFLHSEGLTYGGFYGFEGGELTDFLEHPGWNLPSIGLDAPRTFQGAANRA